MPEPKSPAGSEGFSVRQPAVAGMFYPDDPEACRRLAKSFVEGGAESAEVRTPGTQAGAGGTAPLLGGIVPHAGWICSGAVAGQTIAALAAARPRVDVVVVFGAIHSPVPTEVAALDTHALWAVPGGESQVQRDVGRQLVEARGLFAWDDRFHLHEHAVEVELPLIQQAWPGASVLPVEVPVRETAPAVGVETARRLQRAGLSAVFLASSDLTHYGPNYHFVPAGVGPHALAWAKENDRRVLRLVEEMRTDEVVPEVRSRLNACGAGAIAAMLAACRELGAARGRVIRHTNSYETLAEVAPQRPDNAVGYAAVVVG